MHKAKFHVNNYHLSDMEQVGTWILRLGFCVVMVVSAHAQTWTEGPAPQLKKLDYFVGIWTVTADIKPGPMGAGGKTIITEDNRWMEGRRVLVSHSKQQSTVLGHSSETSYIGYSPDKNAYTYDEHTSDGETHHYLGKFEDDTWTWSGKQQMAGYQVQDRYIMKILTPTSYTISYDMLVNGDWLTMVEGKARKK